MTARPRPRKPSSFFNDRSMAARHEEGCYEKHIFIYFVVWKELSNDGVGVPQEIRPGAGSQTGELG